MKITTSKSIFAKNILIALWDYTKSDRSSRYWFLLCSDWILSQVKKKIKYFADSIIASVICNDILPINLHALVKIWVYHSQRWGPCVLPDSQRWHSTPITRSRVGNCIKNISKSMKEKDKDILTLLKSIFHFE